MIKEKPPLTGSRRIAIAKGETDLPQLTVKKYRDKWEQEFTLPPWIGVLNTRSKVLSSVGSVLHEVIHRETGHDIPCEECKKDISNLDMMTVEDAKKEKERIVNNIYSRAWSHAGWQDKLKLAADKLVSVSTRNKLTPAKDVIGSWFDEAIMKGEKPVGRQTVKKSFLRRVPGGRAVGRNKRVGSAFSSRGKPRYVSSSQMQHDIKTLISKLPTGITAVAGVARSGLSAATMISMYLHLPMFTIRQNSGDVMQTGNGWRLGGGAHIKPDANKVLLVDDTVMTGNSLKSIAPLVEKYLGNNIVTSAVYVNPLALKKPDIHAVDLSWPHLLEWNLFNSVLSPNMAVDFDGILCWDCPPGSDDDGPKYLDFIRNAKPKYIPRKVPIPLIVTARVEKYRAETRAWMDKWGIKANRLVMHPANSTRERERDDICKFKSNHFNKWAQKHRPTPPPLAFIESEDWQAKRIAASTNRMVICPSTGKVY